MIISNHITNGQEYAIFLDEFKGVAFPINTLIATAKMLDEVLYQSHDEHKLFVKTDLDGLNQLSEASSIDFSYAKMIQVAPKIKVTNHYFSMKDDKMLINLDFNVMLTQSNSESVDKAANAYLCKLNINTYTYEFDFLDNKVTTMGYSFNAPIHKLR